ncbi:glycoside hydrolase family protein [endosymbiont of Acanthamoeba sp. UWC8]|uniref:glycoside hydrolase family 3 N-terminal domain-containing protein n=1 Tax=endosymbiont of Acanthamoeba sp. UWC8 TaxID=86106 RepID=UPI0004D0F928|nr:glycoside hydrolase family 3 N-terminal domain-containing protein [endosymbiont of Acanthamoeba sp. UWC8]AIF81682.1 glycoside hydrolase family protein [endosymbiont of Acanthamoeba sp. UWC8]
MEHEFIFSTNNTTYPLEDHPLNHDDLKVGEAVISLEKQIGSMLIMGFEGVSSTDPNVQKTISYLKNGMLGGTILFRYNIENPEQLGELTKSLHEANPYAFIAADQEGGKVQRLIKDKGFTGFPSAYDVANNYDIDGASDIYDNLAKELNKNGINLNFAPVVDINDEEKPCSVIGGLGRSFGGDIEKIVDYANAFIDSHHKFNTFTALKHFPGHGLASGDTHKGMVDVTETAQERELKPFYDLIASDKADMIMTAHVVNTKLDPLHPITLSPTALKTLLRDKDYDGVIVTDDLHMGAIVGSYGIEEAIIRSIDAGNDLLVISNNKAACGGVANCEQDYDMPAKFIDIIKQAINEGKISQERIKESYNRIDKLKNKLQLV